MILILMRIVLTLSVCIVLSCGDDNGVSPGLPVELSFNFDENENWIVGFADYPPGEEEFYELGSEFTNLPPELGNNIPGLKITGNNHSDDLFMYAKTSISGLQPNTTYSVIFTLEFGTNASAECLGVGGSPGSSVYLKSGISTIEPNPVAHGIENLLIMNIDKGNQAQSGADAIVLGHFGNTNACENTTYQLKTLNNANTPLQFATDGSGSAWIIVGTDSGFESTTTIYYKTLNVRMEAIK